jgi:hypothetical protein
MAQQTAWNYELKYQTDSFIRRKPGNLHQQQMQALKIMENVPRSMDDENTEHNSEVINSILIEENPLSLN